MKKINQDANLESNGDRNNLYLQPLQAALFSLVILSLCESLLKGNFL